MYRLLLFSVGADRLSVGITVFCERYYYTSNCSVYCRDTHSNIRGHYTCDPETGAKICMSGECFTDFSGGRRNEFLQLEKLVSMTTFMYSGKMFASTGADPEIGHGWLSFGQFFSYKSHKIVHTKTKIF